MRLLDNAFSPYAFKVRAFLYEKGVTFENADLRTSADREQLRRVNPRDEVPTLVDEGVAISDSTVICEYLEQRFPSPTLLPADAVKRARCRAIEAFSDGDLDACVFVMGTLNLDPALRQRFADAFARAEDVFRAYHARLDAELGAGEFFAGELSLADLAVYPHLRGGAFLGAGVGEHHARLRAWMDRMTARPSIRRAVREMARAFGEFKADPEPFFARGRVHWRAERLEWAVRLGLGKWILEEIDAGRAFFSPAGA